MTFFHVQPSILQATYLVNSTEAAETTTETVATTVPIPSDTTSNVVIGTLFAPLLIIIFLLSVILVTVLKR